MRNKAIYLYIVWFQSFFLDVCCGRPLLMVVYVTLGVLKEISNLLAFFIPLKIVMLISSPLLLATYLPSFTLHEVINYSFLLFIILIALSTTCLYLLITSVARTSFVLWKTSIIRFPSRTKYRNLYHFVIDILTHITIIVIGAIFIGLLDIFLLIPVLITLAIFILYWTRVSGYSNKYFFSSPIMDPKVFFRLISELGFFLTFVFIIIEYYNYDINPLYSLLVIITSRVVYRHMNYFFIKNWRIYIDTYLIKD